MVAPLSTSAANCLLTTADTGAFGSQELGIEMVKRCGAKRALTLPWPAKSPCCFCGFGSRGLDSGAKRNAVKRRRISTSFPSSASKAWNGVFEREAFTGREVGREDDLLDVLD